MKVLDRGVWVKYSKKAFDSAVAYYKRRLKGKVKGKIVFAELVLGNDDAFYSLAPLSKAVHEMGGEMDCTIRQKGKKGNLEVIKDVWKVYGDYKKGIRDRRVKSFLEFVGSVDKKTKKKYFITIFRPPEVMLKAEKNGFAGREQGRGRGKAEWGEEREFALDYKAGWFRKYRWNELKKTAKRVLVQVFALGRGERFDIGFELVPDEKHLELPLEDYLDNFAVAYAFADVGKKMCRSVGLGAESSKYTQTEPAMRTLDMPATLMGCEYEKDIDEPWFRAFRKFSKELGIGRLKDSQVSFSIRGKGYGGKAFFGMNIGYPSPDKKTRWSSVGSMFMKPSWYAQTRIDKREPRNRHCMTETLPISEFIRTSYVDYREMRRRDMKIRGLIEKSDRLFVRGKEVRGGKTDFVIPLSMIRKGKALVLGSDNETIHKIMPETLKLFGIKAGTYGNVPAGEAFFTPESIDGTLVGDVTISIDQSIPLSAKEPLVVRFKKGKYSIVSGPKKLLGLMESKRKESWKLLNEMKKAKALPKSILKSYEKNFMSVGELGINTNPKAKMSRYLIVTEKIARMIHLALGSGYEPSRESMYHWDIVVNAPRQKLDIYGVDKKTGREYWILKKGKFVV